MGFTLDFINGPVAQTEVSVSVLPDVSTVGPAGV